MAPNPVATTADVAKAALQAALSDLFVLQRELDGAGMSQVFVAEERALGRQVVIKVLASQRAAELSSERFEREIRVAARLQHSNIVPVLRAGSACGLPYYVMPFVDGPSLSERSREPDFTIGDGLSAMLDVARALAYAHANDVVHRDIKPSNVLLSGGTAVVTDFGIAKAMLSAVRTGEHKSSLTGTGVALGTPRYMAPEQAVGDPNTDHRADIYAWGVTAYEILAGQHPFAEYKDVQDVIRAQLTVAPRSLAAYSRPIPAVVADLIMSCLEKEPGRRPQRASDLVRVLDGLAKERIGVEVAKPTTRSIAVLPFENVSKSPDDEHLGDGICALAIPALHKCRDLRVVARASTLAFRNTGKNARQIGDELNVDYILAGTVLRSGGRLIVTAELVDARSGFQVWSNSYDGGFESVFDVQESIVRSVVDTLGINITSPARRLIHPASDNMEAYEAYLRGRFKWNLRTEQGLRQSLELFGTALALDPNFALGHAGLADTYIMLAVYGAIAPDSAMPKARAAAESVLERDAESPAGLTARGSIRAFYDHDWEGADNDFRLAVGSRERYPTAQHWYAMHCLLPCGRFAEAESQLTLAHAHDPSSQTIAASFGIVKYYEHDYESAIRIHHDVLDREPGFWVSRFFLGLGLLETGRHSLAIDALRQASLLTRESPEVESALGVAYARTGQESRARAILARLDAREQSRYVSPVLIAQLQLSLGDRAAALDGLERGYALRAAEVPLLARRPTFSAFLGDDRFEVLAARIHPPQSQQP